MLPRAARLIAIKSLPALVGSGSLFGILERVRIWAQLGQAFRRMRI